MNHPAIEAVSTAAVVSAVAVTTLVRASLPWLRTHVVDVPNLRSSHATPVPRGAGAGLTAGILVGAFAGHLIADEPLSMVLVVTGLCTLAITALGLADDVRSLPARTRLIVQVGLAAIAASALSSTFGVGVLTALCMTLLITVFVNAFNFMDGVNGISGLVSAVIAAWLATCGWAWNVDAGLVIASVAVAAGSLGFLPWNMFRAVVFLGDSGSYGLGFVLSSLAVWSWLGGVPLVVAGAPLLIYLADVMLALIAKTRRGLAWDAPHRLHVYQQLSDAGWSHPRVAGVVALSTVAAGLTGVVMTHVPLVGSLMLAATLAGYLHLPLLATRLASQPV